MEEVVLKPEWSYFDVRYSKTIFDFFSKEKINFEQKIFSLDLLRDYYHKDRLYGSILIEELAFRGFTFNVNNESSFLPRCYEPKKIIRINSEKSESFQKINFSIIGLSGIIKKFKITNDLFFDYVPLEGFKTLNKNISLDMVANEFLNAGFIITDIKSKDELSVNNILNLNRLDKLTKVFINKNILIVKDFCTNIDKIIADTPNINKYDIKRLKLIADWFDSDFQIKDFRNISINDYFNFRNIKFIHYCQKKKYEKVMDLIYDTDICKMDKNVSIYIETFIAYLKSFYYVNINPEVGNTDIKSIPAIGTNNTIMILNDNNIHTIKDLLKANLYGMGGLGKGKINNIDYVILDSINNPEKYIQKKCNIQKSLYNIRIEDLFCDSYFLIFTEFCKKEEYIYVRDLIVQDLEKMLEKIKLLGKTKSSAIIKKLTDEKYNTSSPCELVRILFKEMIEENKELYLIMVERIVNNKTLEELGNDKQVSRERIRQLETKGMKILKAISNILYDNVLKDGDYIYIDESILDDILNDECKAKIMLNILKYRSEFYYKDFFNKVLIIHSFPECESFFKNIDVILSGEDEDSNEIMSIDELKSKISFAINKYDLNEYINCDDFNEMIEHSNYKQVGNALIKKGIYVHDIYTNILKEYFKDGMTFNEENCEIMKQKYYEITNEKSDLSIRNITSKLQREKKVILRGQNTYIHIDNVKIDINLLEAIKKYIIHLFENEGIPSVYSDRIYNVFKNELNNFGVDNYSYIYGILRYYYPEDFEYNNFWIIKSGNKGVMRELALVDYLKKDSNYNEGIPKKKIISLFGLSEPFLLNLIFNSTEIHECHNKENLIYYDNYKLSDRLYDKLKKYIDNNIELQYGFISLKHLLAKFGIYLEEEKIIDEYTLCNALKKYLKEYYLNGLYVCKEKTNEVLDEYFFFELYLKNNEIVTRKGFETFAEEKGINSNRVYDVLKNKFSELYQINITDFTRDISISEDIISSIYKIIEKNIEGKQYIPLSDLKKNGDLYRMPSINYSWNEYLLRTILVKNLNDRYVMIDIPGAMLYNEKGILVRKELNINSYIDFLVYVYQENNYYLIDNVNQLYKELQNKGLISDTLPNEFRKIVVDEYGRLKRL